MSNKSIRMLISVSLNVLIIVLGIYLVFIAGSRAYSFGEKVFNEQSIDSEDNARTVEITITTDIQPKKLAELLYDKGLVSDKTIAFSRFSSQIIRESLSVEHMRLIPE